MARSYNGWYASPNLDTRVIEPVKGVRLRVVDNQNVADIFTYLVQQYHKRVDDVTKPHPMDDWGYHYRANRNNPNSLSNHASGTAIDLDATEHPNGVGTAKTFSVKQINTIHDILKELDEVIRWGGDYNSTPDAMHFEVNVPPGHLQAVGKKVRRLMAAGDKKPTKPKKKPRRKSRGKAVDNAIKLLDGAKGKGRRARLIRQAKQDLKKIGFVK